MSFSQTAVLAPIPLVGRYLFFSVRQVATLPDCLTRLALLADGCPPVRGGQLDLRGIGL